MIDLVDYNLATVVITSYSIHYTKLYELSAARALNVVHFLEEQVGIPGERLFAAAFGENQPLASNQTREGRSQNRRIQIVLVPSE